MSATLDFETIASNQHLPLELMRLASSHDRGEEEHVASMVSGMVAARQSDGVICPLMLRRNLLVPAHQGAMTRSAWRVD
jgi:hypothetical protein